jgi:hypothetical protein
VPLRIISSVAIGAACAALTGAGPLEVIYSEVDGDPTALVPGARDLTGTPIVTEFKAIEDFSLSPDGTMWAVKARNEAGSDIEACVLLGSGTLGNMFMQEGQPFLGGVAGELYDFFDSAPGPVSFDTNNNIGFSARAKGGSSAVDEKLVVFNGVTHTVVYQEGDLVTGLVDNPAGNSGDEVLGSSLGSVHLLDSGEIVYISTPIGNCHSTRYPALFVDDAADVQSGVDTIEGETWDSLDLGDAWGTPDGAHRFIQGDTEIANTTLDDILAVDDTVVVRENNTLPGSSIVAADVFFTRMTANGRWYSRGDDPANNDWALAGDAVVRGAAAPQLVAATGDAIDASGSGETWGNVFLAFNGNNNGHWVLAGNTSAADTATDSVIVLNGKRVVVREGDPVDLDGNGVFDDDVFIGRGNETSSAFAPNDLFLTDSMTLYFIAPLRDAAGNDLGTFGAGGEAFIRVDISCPADIAGPEGDGIPDGNIDSIDFLLLIAQWGTPCAGTCDADFTGPGGTPDGNVDSLDYLGLIAQWGNPGNCPSS